MIRKLEITNTSLTFREEERKSSGLGKLGSIKGIQPGHPIRFCAPEQEGGQLSVQSLPYESGIGGGGGYNVLARTTRLSQSLGIFRSMF